ncbi:MAG: hypothetical protein HY537_18115 [Deltaproteobacteria bacterium]|nr:hypothetical protein [Deltaproteobacteria bacterium]
MKSAIWVWFLVGAFLLGCSEKEEQPAKAASPEQQPEKTVEQKLDPQSVQGSWELKGAKVGSQKQPFPGTTPPVLTF